MNWGRCRDRINKVILKTIENGQSVGGVTWEMAAALRLLHNFDMPMDNRWVDRRYLTDQSEMIFEIEYKRKD